MSKQLRVHTLAKEVGVDSKDILAKCHSEGIELKNHMAVISAGLAESIREWFSVGADITSVEVGDRVDLGKVRKPSTRRKQAGADGDAAADGETPTDDDSSDSTEPHAAPEAPVVEIPEVRLPVAPHIEPVALAEPVVVPAIQLLPAVESSPVLAPAARVETPHTPEPPPTPVEKPVADVPAAPSPLGPSRVSPDKPGRSNNKGPYIPPPPPTPKESVRPAGPQLVPKPATLQGPRVVRIEAPEPVRPPPRPRPGPAPVPPPLGPGREGAGGFAARGRVPGKTRADEEAEARKVGRSPRRQGRGAELVVERVKEWRDQDLIERRERLASATGQGLKARRTAEKRRQGGAAPVPTGRKGAIEIVAPIMLKEFCAAIGTPFNVLAGKLMQQTGKLIRINDMIDAETAELLSLEVNVPIVIAHAKTELEKLESEIADRERTHLVRRPPIVAMLGHVDHGKTSLLDAIRQTDVAAGEAGGITQHIGAYRIDRGDWHVTFLDTPGHEAFTAMRARGANLTDVVVLVIAATDGVMPQTVEAINHAKAAGVQIVIALNKIDVPSVDVNKIYGQLSELELVPTEWGGNIDVIKTSATKKIGIDDLIAHLSTLSELLDLKADPTVPAVGQVVEAQMREGRGVVAQVLVREGTLKAGQFVVCGPGSGRIRSLIDDHGKRLEKAGPATPVEILGLDELPSAGDKLYVVEDLSRAKEIAAEVKQRQREQTLRQVRKPQTLEDLLKTGQSEEIPQLNIILKADVQGSMESLRKMLGDFPADKARLRMLHAAVGQVSEADVMLAHTSKAAIIGFNVVADDRARSLAEQYGVDIRTYRIIYEVKDDLLRALEGLLAPEIQRQYRGKAEVRQVFNLSKFGMVAGCAVVDGVIGRAHRMRLLRDGRIIKDDMPLGSLKRFKDDAKEVRTGMECGIKLDGYDDIKPGDVLEAWEVIEVRQQL